MNNMWTAGDFGRSWSPLAKESNPTRDEQLELILRLASVAPPERILDLGCGPGFIGRLFLERFPNCYYVGLDGSEDCRQRAARELGEFSSRCEIIAGDLRADWQRQVDGDFDLLLASQSLHHLTPSEKRTCFRAAHSKLKPGGLFLISDRIEMADASMLPFYVAVENMPRSAAGFGEFDSGYDVAAYKQRHADNGDRPDGVEFHLQALREAGFKADCLWQASFRAILVGQRAET